MSRYKNTKVDKINLTTRYPERFGQPFKYGTTLYNKVPERDSDIFVITTEGDRLDLLAYEFYSDPHLWWFIASINNLKSMNVEPGISLRIPSTTEDAV